jgi:hypothetical protein
MKNPEQSFENYIDGTLTADELEDLERWIAADPANAQQFLLWSATHQDTRVALQADSLRKAATINLSDDDLRQQSPQPVAPVARRFQSFLRYVVVGVAASLLAIVSLLMLQSRTGEATKEANVPTITSPKIAARVIQRIDCVMQDEKWSLTKLNEFEAGQSVRISEGLAVLEFNRGARVTLQGPAELEIVSGNSGVLHMGKLTATVPAEAIGFEVLTPNSRVVDHGTEFGVSVNRNGDSETHVFDGKVELITADAQRPENTGASDATIQGGRILKDAMAARVHSETDGRTASIPANPKGFIRLPFREANSDEHLASITDLPLRNNLVMWFEANQGVQLDNDSRVISWQNLASANQPSASNEFANSSAAWQVNAESRPHWNADHFANHAAIRFSGYGSNEFLTTTPIRTGNDATVLVVCSFGQAEGVGYGHILSVGNRTRLIIERKHADAVGTYSWSYNRKETPPFRTEVLESKDQTPPDTPLLCAVRVSQKSNNYELFSNGQLQSSGKAIGSLAADASHIIGCVEERDRFFFDGSIAEIVVYDHMLDRQSFDQATTALMRKYGIQSESEN